MQDKLNKIKYNQQQFIHALQTLREAIHEKHMNVYVRDATIQRFEYTYETAWKLMKAIFTYKNVKLYFVSDIFKQALMLQWITFHDVWENMIEDRNLTSHTYKERTAEQVYHAICQQYFPAFQYFETKIKEVIEHLD
jgi:nucleotidyltransferase substrate binding protein (TIGR01987 family)